jgi:glycerol-3-phosphate dehydrogenase
VEQPTPGPEARGRHIAQLREGPLDVLVLGGGINGVGILRDLALRARAGGAALRAGLIEQAHFASGTSGRNSQLIHGGLRYLKQLQFHLVRESLRERATLLEVAPGLVEPLPFLMPLYGPLARPYYGAGLWLYDLLAGRRGIARHRVLSRAEVLRREPGLAAPRLSGAALFYDARVHAARFVLANIGDAIRHGALAANYVRAEGWTRRGELVGVAARDALSGESFELLTRKLVDATGPWGDPSTLRLVRGSHLVLPRITAGDCAIAHFDEAGRIVFFIPWGAAGELTLLGTTDVDHASGPGDVRISAEEARYLLGVAREVFPEAGPLEPVSAFSSLRPLLRDDSGSLTRATREHRIWNSPDGVLHVAGGKYTTYRAMSEEASDLIAREVAPALAGLHITAGEPLPGHAQLPDGELLPCQPESVPAGLTRRQAAQIAYAVRHEMAQRLPDLLFVSTYWGYEQRLHSEALLPYALEMGRLLGWGEARLRQETELAAMLTESTRFGLDWE